MVLSMPIGKFVAPSRIRGMANGNLNLSVLKPVELNKTSLTYLMVEEPARAMRALHAEALKYNIVLTTTGRGRTFDQQYALFFQRYSPTAIAGQSTKVYNGKTYWLKKGMAMAAVPGTSNHGFWCADDLAEIINGVVVSLRYSTVQWLFAIAPSFGFKWETTTENWHVTWQMGDVIPQNVLDYEMTLNPQKPDPITPPTPPVTSGDTLMLGIFKCSDAAAVFVGWTDAAGHAIQIEWISTELRLQAFKDAGAKEFTYPAAAYGTCTLLGRMVVGDSRKEWSAADFANWVS